MNISHFSESSLEFFPTARAFRIKNFLPSQIIEATLGKLEIKPFSVHNYLIGHGYAREQVISLPKMYMFMMNEAELTERLQKISQCPVLTNFKGRIYRLLPDSEESIDWHQDLDQNKKLAVSINVSPAGFIGGELLIRHKPTQEVTKIHNNGPGDAVFFEIHPEFEHCVLPVTGANAKFAVTGWYHE